MKKEVRDYCEESSIKLRECDDQRLVKASRGPAGSMRWNIRWVAALEIVMCCNAPVQPIRISLNGVPCGLRGRPW